MQRDIKYLHSLHRAVQGGLKIGSWTKVEGTNTFENVCNMI